MPSNINPNLRKYLTKGTEYSVEQLVNGILKGNRLKLSKAISIIENSLPEQQQKAAEIIHRILPYTGNSYRIAISGVPGVGKSTFINAFGRMLVNEGYKIAILAIDPSSQISKGSILGDKYRMPDLSGKSEVFIRPSANAGVLGGVAAKTRETILLCEASGYDIIIVETIGVGQTEVKAASMTDFFMLLMASGTGDQLQGIKRGIMEVADLLVFTKYDGINKKRIDYEIRQFSSVLKLFPPKPSEWQPKVLAVSSVENYGIEHLWKVVKQYFKHINHNGYLHRNRQQQRILWFYEIIDYLVKNRLLLNFKDELQQIEKQIVDNKIYPYQAAVSLLTKIFKK